MSKKNCYRIQVKGTLHESWSDRFNGMTIQNIQKEGEAPKTSLEGELQDQAALAGVLNTLYDLHITILTVQLLDGNGVILDDTTDPLE